MKKAWKEEIEVLQCDSLLNSPTIRLLRIIGSPFASPFEKPKNDVETMELYQLAVRNKISLLYLETLKRQGSLDRLGGEYAGEQLKYMKLMSELSKASRILQNDNVDFVVFKTLKPYLAVPGDVDIVVLGGEEDYERAVKGFLGSGYKEAVPDGPSAVTGDLMDLKVGIPIDLQKGFEISYITYMDKNKIGDNFAKVSLPDGEEVVNLSPEFDLANTMIHSIIEQLYLLGEFYAFLYHLPTLRVSRFIEIVNQNKLRRAVGYHLSLTAILHRAAFGMIPSPLESILDETGLEVSMMVDFSRNGFKTPHRYGNSILPRVFLEKMAEREFRRSVYQQALRMLNPNLLGFVIREMIRRRTREYYIKDYVKDKVEFR